MKNDSYNPNGPDNHLLYPLTSRCELACRNCGSDIRSPDRYLLDMEFNNLGGYVIIKYLILTLFISAQADDRTDATHVAHAADAGSTVAAILTTGATELNPLALPMLPISIYITERERGKCSHLQAAFQAGRWGATANNLIVIAGGFPWSLAAIPIVSTYVWRREKQKVLDCKVQSLKQILSDPSLM